MNQAILLKKVLLIIIIFVFMKSGNVSCLSPNSVFMKKYEKKEKPKKLKFIHISATDVYESNFYKRKKRLEKLGYILDSFGEIVLSPNVFYINNRIYYTEIKESEKLIDIDVEGNLNILKAK